MGKLLISVIFFASFFVAGCSSGPGGIFNRNNLCFGSNCYYVEIADDAEARRMGLMGRETLAPDEGMLFVFEDEKPRITFWMKNTLLPLDILWLNASGVVVHVETDVPPCTQDPCPTYGPKSATTVAKFVVELNAGQVQEKNIVLGSSAILPN